MPKANLIHGDCIEVMRTLDTASVDAIVTDPPYELGFMGKKWDSSGIAYNVSMWQEALRVLKPGGHLLAFGGTRTYHRMTCAIEDAGFEIRDCIQWIYGNGKKTGMDIGKAVGSIGEDWLGWDTLLKPAYNPIVMGRKPMDGSVAANIMNHGTGGLNIGMCRVSERGRFPANVVFDEAAAGALDEQSGESESSGGLRKNKNKQRNCYGKYRSNVTSGYSDIGGASRFFYCARASKSEKGEGNTHPTVKPLALMRYLVRLVTPPGGTVLDPFCGSGSTLIAAAQEGFSAVGIEQSEEYIAIARRRLQGR